MLLGERQVTAQYMLRERERETQVVWLVGTEFGGGVAKMRLQLICTQVPSFMVATSCI